jgi:hypothetical protein
MGTGMWMRLSIMMICAGATCGAAAQTGGKGVNGGEVVVMEGHPIEFVAKGQQITFYVLEDDGKSPTSTTGFSGRAVIQDAGKTFAVALAPAGPNMFVGQLAMPLGSKARVVFSAKVPGHTLQARFTTD